MTGPPVTSWATVRRLTLVVPSVLAVAGCASGVRARDAATRPPSTTSTVQMRLVAGEAIGAVALGETRQAVSATLGPGTRQGRGIWTYVQDGVRTLPWLLGFLDGPDL